MSNANQLKELVKAAHEGDRQKANEIIWSIKCTDFIEAIEGRRQMLAEDGEQLGSVFYSFLKETSRGE